MPRKPFGRWRYRRARCTDASRQEERNLTDIVYQISVWLIPLVIAIVFHEVAHGYVANMLGDPTARQLGRLTFNPVRHVDPVGTLGLPLILVVMGAPVFGWAKPVPVEARKLNNPRLDMVLVALAGPMMNLFLGVLAVGGLAIATSAVTEQPDATLGFVIANLLNFLLINVFLAIFNLIPLPPFDGGHVIEGMLPRKQAASFARLAPYGFPILLALIVLLPMLSPRLDVIRIVIVPIVSAVTAFLLSTVGLAL